MFVYRYKSSSVTEPLFHEGIVNPTIEGLVVENELYEKSFPEEKVEMSALFENRMHELG